MIYTLFLSPKSNQSSIPLTLYHKH